MQHTANKPCPRARLFWLGVIQLHWLAAIGMLYAMPHGFPVGHRHWWANAVFPWFVIAYALLTTLLAINQRWRPMVAMLLASPVALLAAAAAGLVMYPISGQRMGLAFAVFATVMLIGLRREFRAWWPSRLLLLAILILPIAFGAALPWTQRSADPQTLPAGGSVIVNRSSVARTGLAQAVTKSIRINPNSGNVSAQFGRRMVQVSPLLTFDSMSPDRCWTNLSPRRYRVPPPRTLIDEFPARFVYRDIGQSQLTFSPLGEDGVSLEATSVLPTPIFSHLNTYCEVSISGQRKLSLIFSPAPEKPIDVFFSQYPIGRPERMAYLDAAGVFHVVEATSGEKGPFHELASGPLKRGEPLVLTMLDEGKPFASMTLEDFSAQASTQLSPTAGWGLPVNSIEFRLDFDQPLSTASIYVSLAATSVGRGWDSVGHAAGVYKNRMVIQVIASEAPPTTRLSPEP